MEPSDSIDLFLNDFEYKDFIKGVLIGGSFAVDSKKDPMGDIDIHILLIDTCNFSLKGTKQMKGAFISYLAYPLSHWYKIVQREEFSNTRVLAHLYATGEIFRDDDGFLAQMKAESHKLLHHKFFPLKDSEKELCKYGFWNVFQSVKEAFHQERDHFSYLYYYLLDQVLTGYSRYLQTDVPNIKKLDQTLTQLEYNRQYLYNSFPDKNFVPFFYESMKDPQISSLENLLDYVWGQMGGFDPSDWSIKEII